MLGREFQDNALLIDQERDGVRLTGYAGLPTYSRGNAQQQFLFVNGRPVRDRLLQGALRGAYADFLARVAAMEERFVRLVNTEASIRKANAALRK